MAYTIEMMGAMVPYELPGDVWEAVHTINAGNINGKRLVALGNDSDPIFVQANNINILRGLDDSLIG